MKRKIFILLLILLGYSLKSEELRKEEFIIKGWENSINKIKSAKCKYIVEGERTLMLQDGKKEKLEKIKLYECEWKYKNGKEVVKGKYFDEKEEIRIINEFFYDGQSTAVISIEKDKKNGSIYDGKNPNIFILLPPSMVLFYFYPGISFKELVTNSLVKIVKEEKFNNEFCYVISIVKKINGNTLNFLFWISEDKNFLPIKIKFMRQNNSQVLEIYYQKLEEEILFPCKIVGYNENVNGEKEGYAIGIYKQIMINIEVNEEDFQVKFPPGCSVFDSRLGVSFEIPR